MSPDEAKSLLAACRPSGADAADPQFAEALRLVQSDPALSAWFERQQTFDAMVARGLQDLPVPFGLREAILARAASARAEKAAALPWWHWRRPIPVSAVAAVFVVLAAVVGVWLSQRPDPFDEFRMTVIGETSDHSPHLKLKTNDIAQVRRWLSEHLGIRDLVLPPGLAGFKVNGCEVLDWHGQQVGLICLGEGLRHLHLYVVDRRDLANPPAADQPVFANCNGWKTAAWSHNNKTYLLSGMNYPDFIRRFRKAGQWKWSS